MVPRTGAAKGGTPDPSCPEHCIPLHDHFRMLQDESRIEAFREAIELRVRPGMHVVELGGGTGILSYLAAKQGAKVWCVENNPALVHAATRFLRQNRCHDAVRVVEADAARFVPPAPVDVVICEMLDVAMLREKQLQVIDAFKRNYCRRYGESLPKFIPEASLLAVEPVEHSFEFAGYEAPLPLFQAPGVTYERTRSLAEPVLYSTICYDEPFTTRLAWSGEIGIERAGRLTALRFLTKNFIAIDEHSQKLTSWANRRLVLPLDEPMDVKPGREVRLAFSYDAGASLEAMAASITLGTQAHAAWFQRAA